MALTLIVETGSVVPNANAYIDIGYVDSYVEAQLEDNWTALSDSEKALSIVRATRSIDQLYGPRFASSTQSGSNQYLMFPRQSFWTRFNNRLVQGNEIPRELKDAVAELSIMAAVGAELAPTLNKDDTLTQEVVTVGPITTSKTYSKSIQTESYTDFRRIDLILQPILVSNNTSWTWRS